MSSKYSKRRKHGDSDDESPQKSSRHAGNDEPADSMSIEETNKLRASLGLAPLEDNKETVRDTDDGTNEKIYNEDGFEFRHRKADNWADKKKDAAIKEKLEVAKAKRDVYSKVLKAKKLAESDDEDDSAAKWIEKARQKEEEAKKAAEREKMFNQLDEELGVSSIVEKKTKKPKKRRDDPSDTAGLVVGHARDAFIEGDQILVLQDKGVLDDGDEVLVNPNLMDAERTKRNVELKKRKDPHRNFDEDVDEFGNPKNFGVLAKYDEELEGVQKEQFRLNEKGGVDLEEEKREMEMYRKLKMAGKRLETLEMPKYQLASEFYTQEEMVSFRKVKKGGKKEKNTRKRKVLKASDLVPVESAGEGGKSKDFGRRRRNDSEGEEDGVKKEVEEKNTNDNDEKMETDDGKWQKAMHGNGVDLARLQKLKEKTKNYEEDEESDDDLMPSGGIDLTGVVIDDDAEDELHSVLSKTRKVKQVEKMGKSDEDVGKKVQEMLSSHGVKMEVDEDEDMERSNKDGIMFMDSTMEYCRHIGEIKTLGLGGNRDVDVSEVKKEVKQEEGEEMEQEEEEEKEDDGFDKWKRAQIDKELKEKAKRKKQEKGGWLAAGEPVSSANLDSDDEEAIESAKNHKWNNSEGEEEDDEEYEPVLGQEADVTKGVGAMLKLAAQKGYLNNGPKTYAGPSLEHLKNKAKTQVDSSKNDIEDKYMKKLDRLGTTGRGPLQAFPEKSDYKPEVNITYVDRKGRDMDAKDAYRELSYKFHGRNPGKKQLEKRANRKDKEERMLKTNSYDTPLGTLSKQLKKQKQLSTPYLVITGATDHSTLKKE